MTFIADENIPYEVIKRLRGGVILLRIQIKSPDYIFKMLKWILFESRIKFERNWVFGISRCNDQNHGDFLIFSKRGFRKTTEYTESTEGAKDKNNNSLCPFVLSVV